jgi:hypothetical protein
MSFHELGYTIDFWNWTGLLMFDFYMTLPAMYVLKVPR